MKSILAVILCATFANAGTIVFEGEAAAAGGVGYKIEPATVTIRGDYGVTASTLTVTGLSTFNGVQMNWPSTGTIGGFLKYNSTNTLQWVYTSVGDAVLSSTQTWTGVNTFQSSSTFQSSATLTYVTSPAILATDAFGVITSTTINLGATNVSGTLPTATKSDAAGATLVFTNKTLDTEATGNVFTIPLLVNYKAAVCQNTTASIAFSSPTASGPGAACVTGTNTQYAVAQFWNIAVASTTVQDHFSLPSDWTGNIDLKIKWRTSATSGDVVWQAETICVADAETGDPAFNTASTVADTAKGTTLQFNDAAISNVTVTGCAAGEEFYWKFYRSSDFAGDTLAATADLISLTWTIRRAI